MASLAGFQVIRTLHSEPHADILLCLPPSNSVSNDAPNAHVVLKHLHATATSDAMLDEGAIVQRLLKLLPHANIVRYHRVIDHAKSQVVVMDYYARGDLLAWLHAQPHKRFTDHDARALFTHIVHGVQFLHAHDIAHGAVSLEHCLVADDGAIRLGGLGLACSASTPSTQHIGKIQYLAPEVVRGDVYDPVQADIWALGIVLFMLLTGSQLFEMAAPDDPVFVCVERFGVAGVLENWGLTDAIGNETIALLDAMLQLDFTKRLRSVDAILDHMHP